MSFKTYARSLVVALFLVSVAHAADPSAEPTFNCVGLYWKPDGASADREVSVAYRLAGQNDWRDAMPLWFDPNDHKAEGAVHSKEYRGSIVGLRPDTEYEIRLTMKDAEPVTVRARTWNEQFKIAKTVTLPATVTEAYTIKEGGSAETGYVLYEAPKGAVWEADNKIDNQVIVDASYVIVRGLTLKGASKNGIQLNDVNHVVIENCDISGWGNNADDGWGLNLQSAIYSRSTKLSHIVIQNNQLHHPRSDSNSWNESRTKDGKSSAHPIGPQGISFLRSGGHHVIRYNRIYSDLQHMFNDSMGETHNFSYDGFPGRDSDIHDNFVSHCWDDGMEIEGADMNVRVWNNYIDTTYGAIGAASPSLGPLYIFRNVYGASRKDEKTTENAFRGHYLVKLGNENKQWTQGRMYIFHNTTLQPPPFADGTSTNRSGAQAGHAFTSDDKTAGNIVSRNNLLHLRGEKDWSIRDTQVTPTNDWDYDMFTGKLQAKEGSEAHAVKANPTYDRSPTGLLWLRPGTPGHDAAVRIPNFNDDFKGTAPDIGAVETGTTDPRPKMWPEFPKAPGEE